MQNHRTCALPLTQPSITGCSPRCPPNCAGKTSAWGDIYSGLPSRDALFHSKFQYAESAASLLSLDTKSLGNVLYTLAAPSNAAFRQLYFVLNSATAASSAKLYVELYIILRTKRDDLRCNLSPALFLWRVSHDFVMSTQLASDLQIFVDELIELICNPSSNAALAERASLLLQVVPLPSASIRRELVAVLRNWSDRLTQQIGSVSDSAKPASVGACVAQRWLHIREQLHFRNPYPHTAACDCNPPNMAGDYIRPCRHACGQSCGWDQAGRIWTSRDPSAAITIRRLHLRRQRHLMEYRMQGDPNPSLEGVDDDDHWSFWLYPGTRSYADRGPEEEEEGVSSGEEEEEADREAGIPRMLETFAEEYVSGEDHDVFPPLTMARNPGSLTGWPTRLDELTPGEVGTAHRAAQSKRLTAQLKVNFPSPDQQGLLDHFEHITSMKQPPMTARRPGPHYRTPRPCLHHTPDRPLPDVVFGMDCKDMVFPPLPRDSSAQAAVDNLIGSAAQEFAQTVFAGRLSLLSSARVRHADEVWRSWPETVGAGGLLEAARGVATTPAAQAALQAAQLEITRYICSGVSGRPMKGDALQRSMAAEKGKGAPAPAPAPASGKSVKRSKRKKNQPPSTRLTAAYTDSVRIPACVHAQQLFRKLCAEADRDMQPIAAAGPAAAVPGWAVNPLLLDPHSGEYGGAALLEPFKACLPLTDGELDTYMALAGGVQEMQEGEGEGTRRRAARYCADEVMGERLRVSAVEWTSLGFDGVAGAREQPLLAVCVLKLHRQCAALVSRVLAHSTTSPAAAGTSPDPTTSWRRVWRTTVPQCNVPLQLHIQLLPASPEHLCQYPQYYGFDLPPRMGYSMPTEAPSPALLPRCKPQDSTFTNTPGDTMWPTGDCLREVAGIKACVLPNGGWAWSRKVEGGVGESEGPTAVRQVPLFLFDVVDTNDWLATVGAHTLIAATTPYLHRRECRLLVTASRAQTMHRKLTASDYFRHCLNMPFEAIDTITQCQTRISHPYHDLPRLAFSVHHGFERGGITRLDSHKYHPLYAHDRALLPIELVLSPLAEDSLSCMPRAEDPVGFLPDNMYSRLVEEGIVDQIAKDSILRDAFGLADHDTSSVVRYLLMRALMTTAEHPLRLLQSATNAILRDAAEFDAYPQYHIYTSGPLDLWHADTRPACWVQQHIHHNLWVAATFAHNARQALHTLPVPLAQSEEAKAERRKGTPESPDAIHSIGLPRSRLVQMELPVFLPGGRRTPDHAVTSESVWWLVIANEAEFINQRVGAAGMNMSFGPGPDLNAGTPRARFQVQREMSWDNLWAHLDPSTSLIMDSFQLFHKPGRYENVPKEWAAHKDPEGCALAGQWHVSVVVPPISKWPTPLTDMLKTRRAPCALLVDRATLQPLSRAVTLDLDVIRGSLSVRQPISGLIPHLRTRLHTSHPDSPFGQAASAELNPKDPAATTTTTTTQTGGGGGGSVSSDALVDIGPTGSMETTGLLEVVSCTESTTHYYLELQPDMATALDLAKAGRLMILSAKPFENREFNVLLIVCVTSSLDSPSYGRGLPLLFPMPVANHLSAFHWDEKRQMIFGRVAKHFRLAQLLAALRTVRSPQTPFGRHLATGRPLAPLRHASTQRGTAAAAPHDDEHDVEGSIPARQWQCWPGLDVVTSLSADLMSMFTLHEHLHVLPRDPDAPVPEDDRGASDTPTRGVSGISAESTDVPSDGKRMYNRALLPRPQSTSSAFLANSAWDRDDYNCLRRFLYWCFQRVAEGTTRELCVVPVSLVDSESNNGAVPQDHSKWRTKPHESAGGSRNLLLFFNRILQAPTDQELATDVEGDGAECRGTPFIEAICLDGSVMDQVRRATKAKTVVGGTGQDGKVDIDDVFDMETVRQAIWAGRWYVEPSMQADAANERVTVRMRGSAVVMLRAYLQGMVSAPCSLWQQQLQATNLGVYPVCMPPLPPPDLLTDPEVNAVYPPVVQPFSSKSAVNKERTSVPLAARAPEGVVTMDPYSPAFKANAAAVWNTNCRVFGRATVRGRGWQEGVEQGVSTLVEGKFALPGVAMKAEDVVALESPRDTSEYWEELLAEMQQMTTHPTGQQGSDRATQKWKLWAKHVLAWGDIGQHPDIELVQRVPFRRHDAYDCLKRHRQLQQKQGGGGGGTAGKVARSARKK